MKTQTRTNPRTKKKERKMIERKAGKRRRKGEMDRGRTGGKKWRKKRGRKKEAGTTAKEGQEGM